MNLFDPQRPQVSPDNPALLLDGSAVPQLNVWPLPDGKVQVTVFLRNYSAKGRSYRPYYAELEPVVFCAMLASYAQDPEATLEEIFGWQPQATEEMRPTPALSLTARAAMDIL